MNHIPVKIWLRKFGILSSDEGPGDDEPYIWVFYYRADGREFLQGPLSEAKLHLVAPPCHAGNIQGSQVNVSPFEDSIEPGSLGVGSVVGIQVAFLEEDNTPDSMMDKAHALALKEGQRQGNEILRESFKKGGVGSFDFDEKKFRKAIEDGLMKDIISTGMGIATSTAMGLPFFWGLADRDNFVGYGGATWGLAEVIGNSDDELEFEITSAGGETDARYNVRGAIRRTDTDEVPTIAAMKTGPESILLYARQIGDTLSVYSSKDSGRTFEPPHSAADPRQFHSGPGVAASGDGRHCHVMGLSTGDHYFHKRSSDHGESWSKWEQMGEKEFKSAPAVACSADGKWVHAVGRAKGDHYFHRVSGDSGRHWSSWVAIGEADEFQSSPAVTVSPDGSRVVVFGTAHRKVFCAGSNDHGETWSRWESIPVQHVQASDPMRRATSAPAAVFTTDKVVRVVCRGYDHTFNYTESSDGGRTWPTYWTTIDGQFLNSSPALLIANGRPCYFGLGSDLTLQRCVQFGGTWGEPEDPHLEWGPVVREWPLKIKLVYY